MGSVVQLGNGDTKLMIVSRFPIYENEGQIGYFEYSSCIYPTGIDGSQFYFFNSEVIAEVYFEGYIDIAEEEEQKTFAKERENITYPQFKVEKPNEE
ncbi:DUF4176 domain-containing protein [Streptococcus sp. DD11]|uniref:DUF4176 domain-containing protein n=1 Tax=Streptococcus sp. DD11 TaxID=1777879 RepID=UPI002407DE55|nr:DUF4176 domain-containing protein [Streptococcus sp. DD11]